jgi:hypothetical protein
LRSILLLYYDLNLVLQAQKATKREPQGQVPRTSDKKERGKERSACQRSELELELIQTQMAQKPVLRDEGISEVGNNK